MNLIRLVPRHCGAALMLLMGIFASGVGEKCQNVSKFNSVIVGDMFRVRRNREEEPRYWADQIVIK